jgi:hypothetical protein
MELLQRLLTRYRAWRLGRQVSAAIPLIMPASQPLFRDVSSSGVRIFSLCAGCGARLEMSATLCNACAQRRSPSSF